MPLFPFAFLLYTPQNSLSSVLVKCFSKIFVVTLFVVTLNEKDFAAETLHRVYVFLKRVNTVRKLETPSECSVIKPHA